MNTVECSFFSRKKNKKKIMKKIQYYLIETAAEMKTVEYIFFQKRKEKNYEIYLVSSRGDSCYNGLSSAAGASNFTSQPIQLLSCEQ